MELDFGRRFKKNQCPGCKLEFRYKESEDGALTYDFKEADVQDLYIKGVDGVEDERLVDIARHNSQR